MELTIVTPLYTFKMLNIKIDATYPSAGSTNPDVELRYAEIDFETGSVSNYKLVTALSKVFLKYGPTHICQSTSGNH